MSGDREGRVRILFISSRADPGGGPEHLQRLLEGLSPDVDAWVACPDEPPYAARFASLPRVRGMVHIAHRAFRPSDLWALCAVIRREGIGIVHSHGKGAGLLGRPAAFLSGIPCVHTFHGVHMGQYGRFKAWLYTRYERLMGRLTARGIAVSDGERDRLLELGFLRPDRLALVNNGVVIPPRPVEPPAEDRRLDVVVVSRFDFQKNTGAVLGIMERLEAMGVLGRFRFLFVGDGEERAEIERTATERWRDACRFTGFVDSIGRHLETAFCCLSTSRWEGMPLAVLEAMSFGLPVVATDVIGNRDAVANPDLLFPLGDSIRAAGILSDLAGSAAWWQECGGRNRERVAQQYSVGRMVAETEAIYKCL